MDPKEVFLSMGIAIVAIVAILSWMTTLNIGYNTDVGSTFEGSLHIINETIGAQIRSTGNDLGNNTQLAEGAGESDQQQGLIKKSLSSLSKVTSLIGLVPNFLYAGATIMGIPPEYSDIAVTMFIIAFALTIAYLLLLGAKKL